MADRIELDDWTVDATLGVLESEQRSVQPLRIALAMELDFEESEAGDLSRSVDYAAVQAQVGFLVQHGRWRLMETIAAGVARLVLAPPGPGERRAAVDAVEVHLRKPAILDRCVPGVRVARVSTWCDLQTRMLVDKVWVDTLAATPRAGAYRINLDAGAVWSVPPGLAVYVIGGTGSADGRAVQAGDRFGASQIAALSAPGAALSVLAVGNPLGAHAS